jgi:DNA-binding transcriptional ArsR family regulator
MVITVDKVLNADLVNQAMQNKLDHEVIDGLSEIFKALSDPTRIRLIHAMMQGELCVYDLAYIVGMNQSAVSHQLRVLRNLRIVKRRKEGKTVFYSIDDQHIEELFNQALRHAVHP